MAIDFSIETFYNKDFSDKNESISPRLNSFNSEERTNVKNWIKRKKNQN